MQYTSACCKRNVSAGAMFLRQHKNKPRGSRPRGSRPRGSRPRGSRLQRRHHIFPAFLMQLHHLTGAKLGPGLKSLSNASNNVSPCACDIKLIHHKALRTGFICRDVCRDVNMLLKAQSSNINLDCACSCMADFFLHCLARQDFEEPSKSLKRKNVTCVTSNVGCAAIADFLLP